MTPSLPCYRAWRLLVGSFLIFAIFVTAQDLSTNVLSITSYPACTDSPLFTDSDLNNPIVAGATTLKAGTNLPPPCDLVGHDEQITQMIFDLSPNQAPGAEVFLISLTGLPSPLQPTSAPADPNLPCSSTDQSDACALPKYATEISYSTSNAASVYQTFPEGPPIPYAYFVHQCPNITFTTGQPPVNGRYHFIYEMPADGPQGMTQGSGLNTFKGPDGNTVSFPTAQCTAAIQPSIGPIIFKDSYSVCPGKDVLGEDIQKYYVQPDQVGSDVGPTAVLMCPNTASQNWTAMWIDIALPMCQRQTILPNPVELMSITFYLRNVQYTGPPTDPMATKRVISTSTIQTTTLQGGAMHIDSTHQAMAAIISTDLGTSLVSEPLLGQVVVCGTDTVDVKGIQGSEFISDVLEDNPTWGDVAQNPWRERASYLDGCTVPASPQCRRNLKGDPTINSFYTIKNIHSTTVEYGSGWNQNGMPADIYAQRPEIADLMCRSGLGGNGVPGYQQSSAFSQRTGTTTVCQDVLSTTLALGGDSPTLSSYTNVEPQDFNPVNNQYWMYKLGLLRDLETGASLNTHTRVSLWITGTYQGGVQFSAKGQFTNQSMECNSVSDAALTGAISFAVYNPSPITGTYRVEVRFNLPDDAAGVPISSVLVDNTQPVTLSVEPGKTSPQQVIAGFSYTGPSRSLFGATLYLYSDVESAFSSAGGTPLSVEPFSCTVSDSINTYNSTFGQVGAENDDSNTFSFKNPPPPCYPIQIFKCWHAQGNVLLWWMLRISFTVLIPLIVFVLLPVIAIYAGLRYSVVAKTHKLLEQKYRIVSSEKERQDATDKHIKDTSEAIKQLQQQQQPPSPTLTQEVNLEETGEGSNEPGVKSVLVNRKSQGLVSPAMLNTIMMVSLAIICLAFVPLAQTEVRVINVSAFQEAVFVDGTGQTQNFTDSEFATLIELQVIPEKSTSVSRFAVKLTVVPSTSLAQQKGFADVCQSTGTDQCQVTVPAEITVEVQAPVWEYELKKLQFTPGFHVPYVYMYNLQSSVNLTQTPLTPGYVCSYAGMTKGSQGQINAPGFHIWSQSEINAAFQDAKGNADHFRCPATAPEPVASGADYGNPAGFLEYMFHCKSPHTATTIDMTLTAQVVAMKPWCSVSVRSNPPNGIGVMRFNITVPELLDPSTGDIISPRHTESVAIQSAQQGLLGSSNVSEPYRLFSVQIQDRLSASASRGPYLPEYLIMCDDDDTDPGVLNMVPDPLRLSPQMRQAYAQLINPYFANPWPFSPQQVNGAWSEPIPSEMGWMTNDAPHATFYVANLTQISSYGPKCGEAGVSPNIYSSNVPAVLQLSALSSSGVTIPIEQLIPQTQGGLGEFPILTCIPPFGVQYNDVNSTMPCVAVADMMALQAQARAMVANGEDDAAKRLHFTHNDPLYNPPEPNEWCANGKFYMDATRSRARSGFSSMPQFQVGLLIAGQFIGYLAPKPRGEIDVSTETSTFCQLYNGLDTPAITGDIYYTVCNPTLVPASYALVVQCGWRSQFDENSWSFLSGTTVLNGGKYTTTLRTETRPSHLNFERIEAGKCITAAASQGGQGAFLFDGLFEVFNQGSTDPYADSGFLFDQNGDSRIGCALRLFAQDTVDPQSVIVNQTFPIIVCPIQVIEVPNHTPPPAGYTPIPVVEPTRSNTPSPTPSPKAENTQVDNTWTIVIWCFIGAVILITALVVLFLCIQNARNAHMQKKIVRMRGGETVAVPKNDITT